MVRGEHLFFKLERRAVAERAVAAVRVVEGLDVIENQQGGGGVGVVIDGCPPLIELCEADIQRDFDRRRPGQSEIVTPRDEADACRILSGVFDGKTLGTPICVAVMNKDARPDAYREMETAFRPSHADWV